MRIKILSNAIFLVLLLMSSSCNRKQDSLEKIFTIDELKDINSIIDFYDNHVQSMTDETIPIEEAYITFIVKNRPSSTNEGNPDVFYINSKDRNDFLKTVDINLLLEIYEKYDSTITSNVRTKERLVIYPPFLFNLNCNGKFMEFLIDLSTRNPFYKDIVDEIENMGDISPTIIGKLLHENDNIDFSKREERLVFIISFLEFENDFYEYYVDRKNAP